MTTIPCLRCGDPFERKNHGPRTKYCPSCRARRHAEKEHDRRLALVSDQAFVRGVADNLRPYLTADMWAQVEEYIAALGIPPETQPPIVPDRMPEGASTDGGPNEGMTASFKDVQAELDIRYMDVIMHDWFRDNPHWLEGVHN